MLKYRIGDFSKITKISSRMLRYLDNEGLLKPSSVEDNGYRYYSESELERATKINRLRRYQFSYDEIRVILEQHLENDTQLYLNQLDKLKGVLKDYDLLIKEIEETHLPAESLVVNRYDVQVMHRRPMMALEQRRSLKLSDLEAFLEEQVSLSYEQGVAFGAKYFLTFYSDAVTDEDAIESDLRDVGYYQPIVTAHATKAFRTVQLEEGLVISTLHYGSYDEIIRGYMALYDYAEDQGYDVVGPISERYFVDAYYTSNEQEYVTEIFVSVLKKTA